MTKSWADLEDRVREIASHIWSRPCNPGREAGVNVDAVLQLRQDACIYIEITERRVLNKVREDITKLIVAKLAAATKGIFAQCYAVIEGKVTASMTEAGAAHFITVLSVEDFEKQFYDFDGYKYARGKLPFGSAVNPLTGRLDEGIYVPVKYIVEGAKREVSISDLCEWISSGRHIVLLGEYGSGKSRCLKQIFEELASDANKNFQYPIAINLRDCWGLKRAGEIVRRHYTDLGLEELQASAVKAALAQSVLFLLDGFDELGSQSWSSDDGRLRSIRAQALAGVRDLIQKSECGILISGREHYFQNQEEMLSALGIDKSKVVLIRAKDEFTDEEAEQYFDQQGLDISIPAWLPRRPLICQTVAALPEDDIETIFGLEGNEAAFWNKFVRVVATRDALINASLDADSILSVLTFLGRATRTKSSNIGPLTPEDLQRAFESAVGKLPIDDASVMLQRLPGLGRVHPDSGEMQFVDVAILDTLRAKDIADILKYDDDLIIIVACEKWANPLGDLGQRIVSQSEITNHEMVRTAKKVNEYINSVLISDILASAGRGGGLPVDFEGMKLNDGEFASLNVTERGIQNVTISESTIHTLKISEKVFPNLAIISCAAGRVYGAASIGKLPSWIQDLTADYFESAQNVASIRAMGLSTAHEILVTIIKKTFFQPGSGRKEEALMRGLARIARGGLPGKVLNRLQNEGLISRFKGDQGWVYAPNRAEAGRMKTLVEELGRSGDPIWEDIGKLSDG